MSTNVHDVMSRTDWAAMRDQKIDLLTAISQYPALEGLLNWIDELQDAVVADDIATAEEVFWPMDWAPRSDKE